jgi:hypothetical protein
MEVLRLRLILILRLSYLFFEYYIYCVGKIASSTYINQIINKKTNKLNL